MRTKTTQLARYFPAAPTAGTAPTLRTYVMQFRPGAFTFSANPIQLLFSHLLPATGSGNLTKCYVGLASLAAAKPWDFDTSCTQVLFSGSAGAVFTGTLRSDPVNFDLPLSRALNVAIEWPTATPISIFAITGNIPAPALSASFFSCWFKASVSEASSVTKSTGYTSQASRFALRGIEGLV